MCHDDDYDADLSFSTGMNYGEKNGHHLIVRPVKTLFTTYLLTHI